MNPLIKKQLENCSVANIPAFDEDTTSILIPKGAVNSITKYQIGKCYLVELDFAVMTPSECSTLSVNWNNGTVPKYSIYKCEISQIMGKMIKIRGFGVISDQDTMDMWEGWVPRQCIKLIKELM